MPASTAFPKDIDLLTATIQELQEHLTKGNVTSVQLVEEYLSRIKANDQQGPALKCVKQVAPRRRVLAVAQYFDQLRKQGVVLSPLHGMENAARGGAGRNSFTAGDATVIAKLRAKGAIILGKTGEPAPAFGGFDGGKHDCQSAYVSPEDRSNTSTGSAVAVAAGLCAAALDHDGSGSSVIPVGRNALFALRPTRGLVSRRGIIGCSGTDYTIVPMAKSAYDTALLSELMAGVDLNDPLSSQADAIKEDDYRKFTLSENATFKGKRLGAPRKDIFDDELRAQPHLQWIGGVEPVGQVKAPFDAAVDKMRSLGATIIDPADMPIMDRKASEPSSRPELVEALKYYLGTSNETKVGEEPSSIGDAKAELLPMNAYQQQLIEALEQRPDDSEPYRNALCEVRDLARQKTFDSLLDTLELDALVAPCNGLMLQNATFPGCPIAVVPWGEYDNGSPVGLCFIGRKGAEPTLLALMAAFEAHFAARPVAARLQAQ